MCSRNNEVALFTEHLRVIDESLDKIIEEAQTKEAGAFTVSRGSVA